MHNDEPISSADTEQPRHPHQEIADLLAVALYRLRAKDSVADRWPLSDGKDAVGLGFTGHQRVNTNPDHFSGVRE